MPAYCLTYPSETGGLLASERDSIGVDNAKSGICYIYVCMDGWMDGTYAL